MASHANGHANGHGPDGPSLPPEPVLQDRPAKGDDKALSGDAFATAGEWLAARRRALRLSLEDVEAATRIREDYLAAIEEMDPRRMPAGPYAPGFVRTYALHLELDPEAVTSRFREEMSPRRLRAPQAPVRERTPVRIVIPPQVWGFVLAVAAVGGLVALGWLPERGREELIVPAVPESLADWAAAEVRSRRTSVAQELVAGPDLALRARVPVWLEARGPDGEELIARRLEAGEIWTTPRLPGILVSTDNGAAVEVLLDGRAQGRLGPPGLPVTSWRADEARGLVAPPEAPPEAVGADATGADGEAAAPEDGPDAAVAEADGADEIAPAEPVDDGTQLLSDLEAEDALVTPDLPSEPEISVEALPPLIIGQGGFVPDPEETAAAEGRAPPAETPPAPSPAPAQPALGLPAPSAPAADGRAPLPGPAAPDL